MLQLRALGIERAFPSAMVATGATFVSVTWARTLVEDRLPSFDVQDNRMTDYRRPIAGSNLAPL